MASLYLEYSHLVPTLSDLIYALQLFRKYYGVTPHLFTFNVFEVVFLKRIYTLSLLFHAVCKSLECLDRLHLTWLWTWLGLNIPPYLFSYFPFVLNSFLNLFHALFCISWVFFNISILSLDLLIILYVCSCYRFVGHIFNLPQATFK